ncbi:MAG: hypothetical protein CUN49_14905 [Candidatus Thermofonsia Clade 1 bacterium]|jgi:uncharacterized membrane protein (UPF0127 family)|uniref:DUF192 domain-containing protein n=1 Tax=Candidatus Thermofonsia Clade 1 bacterium TaxID=2364210 RepID=A0A2M8PAM0_9CHLR|nr:MAG: hypothetical protein CUN49_14905 [Candidatus Thermofonsia Clade 1 bacterium]PJF43254.1 MAG: hypothetical protein CUN50_00720 [Candidatus Thermofonsia Clade 1 bacterium]RMF51274.1 MAG: DUF192 domain-containing protein [Chloroflexota bacterium]
MSHLRTLRNERGEVLLARARWCSSYWCRLRGLMFRRSLPEDEGLIFVYGRESALETSIHMLFMAFPIAAIWLDAQGRVVDKVLAKPWRLAYVPKRAAQYVIEACPALLERVQIGEKLTFSALE